MSEFKTIQGFGSVTFKLSGRTVTLDYLHNRGTISSELVKVRKVTDNHKKVVRKIGWDNSITLRLTNLIPGDWEKLLEMHSMIDDALDREEPVEIMPRHDDTSIYNVSIKCWLVGKITYEDIAVFEAGQDLELEFECEELSDQYPFLVQQTEPDNLVTEDGDNLVTEDDKQLIKE